MHGFSTVDGFVEITESVGEMIKFVANEPSVGLFYVQQHAQNAVPNVINLKKNVVEKSRETNLHVEDLEDSITMIRSSKECGFPIADDMIRDIKKSLAIISTKQPRRGLISSSASGFQMGKTSTWGLATWGHNGAYAQKDSKITSNYFSTVLKTAKEKASNFKWPQLDSKEATSTQSEKLLSYANPSQSIASASTSSSLPDVEADELPLSSQAANELQADREDQDDANLPPDNMLSLSENYDNFKAAKEVKLEEWLGGIGDHKDELQERK